MVACTVATGDGDSLKLQKHALLEFVGIEDAEVPLLDLP
jgi:hypothetical protein